MVIKGFVGVTIIVVLVQSCKAYSYSYTSSLLFQRRQAVGRTVRSAFKAWGPWKLNNDVAPLLELDILHLDNEKWSERFSQVSSQCVFMQETIKGEDIIQRNDKTEEGALLALGLLSVLVVALLVSSILAITSTETDETITRFVAPSRPNGWSADLAFRRAKSMAALLDPGRNDEQLVLNFNEGRSPFGLKKNAEVWNGRIAMEIAEKKGLIQLVEDQDPSELASSICFLTLITGFTGLLASENDKGDFVEMVISKESLYENAKDLNWQPSMVERSFELLPVSSLRSDAAVTDPITYNQYQRELERALRATTSPSEVTSEPYDAPKQNLSPVETFPPVQYRVNPKVIKNKSAPIPNWDPQSVQSLLPRAIASIWKLTKSADPMPLATAGVMPFGKAYEPTIVKSGMKVEIPLSTAPTYQNFQTDSVTANNVSTIQPTLHPDSPRFHSQIFDSQPEIRKHQPGSKRLTVSPTDFLAHSITFKSNLFNFWENMTSIASGAILGMSSSNSRNATSPYPPLLNSPISSAKQRTEPPSFKIDGYRFKDSTRTAAGVFPLYNEKSFLVPSANANIESITEAESYNGQFPVAGYKFSERTKSANKGEWKESRIDSPTIHIAKPVENEQTMNTVHGCGLRSSLQKTAESYLDSLNTSKYRSVESQRNSLLPYTEATRTTTKGYLESLDREDVIS